MPASSALGVAGSASLISPKELVAPTPPQPARTNTATRKAESRTPVWWRAHAQGHVLAQRHALALADVPLPLQVLRVRDAQAPSALARRGGAADRPCGAARCQGVAGPDRRGAGGAFPARGARLRGLRRLRGVG